MINIFSFSIHATLVHVIPSPRPCVSRWLFISRLLLRVFLFVRTWFSNVWHKCFFYIYIYCFYTALLEEGRPSLNWSAFTTSAHIGIGRPERLCVQGVLSSPPLSDVQCTNRSISNSVSPLPFFIVKRNRSPY